MNTSLVSADCTTHLKILLEVRIWPTPTMQYEFIFSGKIDHAVMSAFRILYSSM